MAAFENSMRYGAFEIQASAKRAPAIRPFMK